MGTIRGCSYVEGKELGAGELQTKQNPTIKKQKTEVKGEPGRGLVAECLPGTQGLWAHLQHHPNQEELFVFEKQ